MSKYSSEYNKYNIDYIKEYDYQNYKSDVDSHYYPNESDTSKNGGHTIYLVTKDEENYIKEKSDEINKSKDNKEVNANINENCDEIININKKDDDTLVSQRSIEIQIYKGKFIFLGNSLLTFKQGNFSNEFKVDKNKDRYKDSSDKDIIKDMNNIEQIESNFKPTNKEEYNDGKKIFELNFNNLNDNKNKLNMKQTFNKDNEFFNRQFNLNSKQLDMNLSYDNKENINSLYNSLVYFKSNINKDLDNSKIIEKSFLSRMKNEDRRKSLKNAIIIYDRFKSFGKLKKMNLYSSALTPLEIKIKKKIINSYENDDNKINDEKINKKDKNHDNKIIKSFNKDNVNEKNNENNDKNIIKIFNSNNIKEDKEKETVEESNNHEFSFSSELKKNLENKENKNIEEKLSKNNISTNNEFVDVLNTVVINQSISDIKGDKQNKENAKKHEEKKENNNIMKLNKSMDFKKKNNIKFKINDYFFDSDNDIKKSKEIQTKRIKHKNPSHFIRKVIREEHYYIDENGKEKIYEVKQRLISEGNNKEKIWKPPYIKKFKIKGLNSKNKKEENKKIINSSLNTNSSRYNIDEKEKNAISAKFKVINNLKKKINLVYLKNKEKKKSQEREIKKGLELNESNLTEIIPDSFSSKNIFKNFNNLFFKNNINDFNIKKNIINETKTQENKNVLNNFKEPISAKEKNIISFNNLNNSLNMKKDIFSIKKEKPIIIKSCKYIDNSSRIISSKISLNKHKYKNTNNNLDKKKLFNYYYVKNSNHINEISSFKENDKSNEFKENNIKVNKMERLKKLNTEKIFNINSINRSGYLKRDFNKNHLYHEIKNINNSQKRLSSNSQNNFFQDISNDELNSSNRIKIYSVNSFNTEKKKNLMCQIYNSNIQNDFNKTMTKRINFQNKSNSESYFILNTKFTNRIAKSKDKKNYKYYESKSTKKKNKDSDNERDRNTGKYATICSTTLDKNLYKKDSKDGHYYQNLKINFPIQYYDYQ